jgi:hypothetical protein
MSEVTELKKLEEDSLADALSDLAELVKPLRLLLSPELRAGLSYLLLLWGAFYVYPLEPETSAYPKGARIITLEGGWKIFDYGDYLATSPGEHYGVCSTRNLIDTSQKMIALLEEKGVTKIGILGHPIAQRAAWMDCLIKNIEVINYEPTAEDWNCREHIVAAQAKAAEERAKLRKRIDSV